MATRSAIGFVEHDGSVHAIYCHWDGYLEGVGDTLLKHYNDTYKVLDLLELGDISSLGEELGVKHPFSFHTTNLSSQAYDDAYGKMTTAYGRDRGEKCPAKDFHDVVAFRDHYSDCDYFYLYDGKEWSYVDRKMLYNFKPIPMMVAA
jgi:hypothetical protein